VEVMRNHGPDHGLLTATVTVLWTISAAIIIRRVEEGMTGHTQTPMHLEEAIEQCWAGENIHILTDDPTGYGEWQSISGQLPVDLWD
jgi:hypothetical protein